WERVSVRAARFLYHKPGRPLLSQMGFRDVPPWAPTRRASVRPSPRGRGRKLVFKPYQRSPFRFPSQRKEPIMDHVFDEFSKSLTESLPRRQSLRRLGAVFASAILSPLGMETWAGHVDPCKAFCKCRNPKQQNQCLDACKKCNGNTGRL